MVKGKSRNIRQLDYRLVLRPAGAHHYIANVTIVRTSDAGAECSEGTEGAQTSPILRKAQMSAIGSVA